jgi:hypothetical protein
MGCFSWLGIRNSRATRTRWSGWSRRRPLSGVLLSLPLVYALLSLLPLCWPRVLKAWVYPHLARGVHHLYRLALATLFSAGLSSQGSIGGLLVMGSCVKMADGAWVRGEIEEDGTWRLELAGYDISQIPLARILRGQLLGWPPETLREPVPNA